MVAADATPAPSATPAASGGAPHGFAAVWQQIGDVLSFSLISTKGANKIDVTVGSVLAAVVVLVGLWIVTNLVRRAFVRYQARHEPSSQAAIYTVSRITQYILLVIGFLIALYVAGVPMSQFGLFIGALGVGLGFGLQTIFNNFVSGLIILFEHSLKVGDFVELASGVHGTVRDIRIRATLVTTNDNIDILVPNSEFVNKNVVNWTLREASRRLHVPFHVAYGCDRELVKKAALEAAADMPFTLVRDGERKPQVWLTSFGDSWINFELVVWLTSEATRRVRGVVAAYNWALHGALQQYDIDIPFPQRDLNVRSWFGLDGEAAVVAAAHGEVPRRKTVHDNAAQRPPAPTGDATSTNDAAQEVQRGIEEEAKREADRERQEADAKKSANDEAGATDSSESVRGDRDRD